MFDKIVEVVSAFGYLGVFALMLLENIFPPIPSELIMPLAGFVAARGELNFAGVIAVGTAGSVVGALPSRSMPTVCSAFLHVNWVRALKRASRSNRPTV